MAMAALEEHTKALDWSRHDALWIFWDWTTVVPSLHNHWAGQRRARQVLGRQLAKGGKAEGHCPWAVHSGVAQETHNRSGSTWWKVDVGPMKNLNNDADRTVCSPLAVATGRPPCGAAWQHSVAIHVQRQLLHQISISGSVPWDLCGLWLGTALGR
jgi:hypothetical protein